MKNKHRTVSRRVVGAMVPAVVFLLLLVPLSKVSAHSLYIQSTRYAVTVPAPEKDREKYRQMKLTTTLTFQIDNARKTPGTDSH